MIADDLSYQHSEAFCLMEYRADDGSESEFIWNSRDGVTPFMLTLRSGKQARHVNWSSDVRIFPAQMIALQAAYDRRVFIDMSLDAARAAAQRMVDRFPQYAGPSTVQDLAREYYGDGHNPSITDMSEWRSSITPTIPTQPEGGKA